MVILTLSSNTTGYAPWQLPGGRHNEDGVADSKMMRGKDWRLDGLYHERPFNRGQFSSVWGCAASQLDGQRAHKGCDAGGHDGLEKLKCDATVDIGQ